MKFEMPVDNHNKHADGAEQQKSPLSLYQSQISHNDASDGGKKARQNINDTEHVKRGQPLFVVSIIIAIAVVFAHRSNIQRMINGTEPKFSFKSTGEKTVVNEDELEKVLEEELEEEL